MEFRASKTLMNVALGHAPTMLHAQMVMEIFVVTAFPGFLEKLATLTLKNAIRIRA